MDNRQAIFHSSVERSKGIPCRRTIFILALEVMFFQVRSNEQVEGIKINCFEFNYRPTLTILISEKKCSQ